MLAVYYDIFIVFLLIIVVGLILLLGPLVLGYHKPNNEKLSAYECGFNPFGDARNKFEVRFYLVAILFIIFDIEISFLMSWGVVVLGQLTFLGFYASFTFIFILTLVSYTNDLSKH